MTVERGCAQAELVEDLRPVLQVLHPGRPGQVLGNDDRVARHRTHSVQRAEERSRAALADDRAVSSEHVDALLVGLLPWPARLREVVRDSLVRLCEGRRIRCRRCQIRATIEGLCGMTSLSPSSSGMSGKSAIVGFSGSSSTILPVGRKRPQPHDHRLLRFLLPPSAKLHLPRWSRCARAKRRRAEGPARTERSPPAAALPGSCAWTHG